MSSLTKTCAFCGSLNEPDAQYCGRCGKQFNVTEEVRPTITPGEHLQNRVTPILDQASTPESTHYSSESTQPAYYTPPPVRRPPSITKLYVVIGVLGVLLIGAVGFAFGQVIKNNSQTSISITPSPANQSGIPLASGSATPTQTASPSTASQPRLATVTVSATQGWQNTGVFINVGDQVTIRYLSGLWTSHSGVFAPFDGIGQPNGYICANLEPASQCVEAVPDAIKGSLVGKVGTELLKIGDYLKFAATQGGSLYLRMNDGDDGLYDNQGSITVQIEVF